MAKGQNSYIYGIHDAGGEDLLIHNGEARGWVLVTEAIRDTPHETKGSYHNYRAITDRGLGLIVRLNFDYGPEGTIPTSDRYDNFAQRAANFVRSSPGANIWLIGNEMNFEREQPRLPNSNQAEPITPRRYAECYKKVRNAIRNVPGHQNDVIVVGAMGPWNAQTPYEADPEGKYPANKIPGAPGEYPYHGFFGDFIQYGRDLLLAIGRENCDAIAIHAYSHGFDPQMVFSKAKMGWPFEKYHYDFYTYRDQMEAIPAEFRDLPVYLTEMNGDENPDHSKWPDVNSGWIKNAYQELNDWNKAGHQQIHCGILYRWIDHDDWSIMHKHQVHADLKDAVAKGYQWDPTVRPKKPARPAQPARQPAQPRPKPIIIPTVTNITIQNVTANLPGAGSYPNRDLAQIKHILLHHTETLPTATPEQVAQGAVRDKKSGIPYHFLVSKTGEVFQTQPLTAAVDPDRKLSQNSVAVALVGNFTLSNPPSKQLGATAAVLTYVADQLDLNASAIQGYSELADSTSPGRSWEKWQDSLLKKVRGFMLTGLKPVSGVSQVGEPATPSPRPQPSQPRRPTPSTTTDHQARFVSHRTPRLIEAGQRVTVPLTLQNVGSSEWDARGSQAVAVRFKWYNALNRAVDLGRQAGLSTPLPDDVSPNEQIKVEASLVAPSAPGLYRLKWDLWQRQGGYFSEQEGAGADAGLTISGVRITPKQTAPAADLSFGLPSFGAEPAGFDLGLAITDLSRQLPRNPAQNDFPSRALSEIRGLVLHHSGTAPHITPAQIAEYLVMQRGQPGITCHYCISAEGRIYQTQPLTKLVPHAGQFSLMSVGITLLGDFDTMTPPIAQLGAVVDLLQALSRQLGLQLTPRTVRGYGELANTTSPGQTWPQWRAMLFQHLMPSAFFEPSAPPAPLMDEPAIPAISPIPAETNFADVSFATSALEKFVAERQAATESTESSPASPAETAPESSSSSALADFIAQRQAAQGLAFCYPMREKETRYYKFKQPYASGAFKGKPHPGVDFHEDLGAEVFAIADGRVLYKRFDARGYGHYLVLEHTLTTGEKVYSLYSHLQDGSLDRFQEGQIVKQKTLVGREGVSGAGSGNIPHLHFEIKKTPSLGLYRNLTLQNIEQSFYDPYEFLENSRYKFRPLS